MHLEEISIQLLKIFILQYWQSVHVSFTREMYSEPLENNCTECIYAKSLYWKASLTSLQNLSKWVAERSSGHEEKILKNKIHWDS